MQSKAGRQAAQTPASQLDPDEEGWVEGWIFIKRFLILRHPRVVSGTVIPALMIYRLKCLGIFTPTCFVFLKLAGLSLTCVCFTVLQNNWRYL